MVNKSLGARALQAAGCITLCAFGAAQADPFSLQGVCHLTSIVSGNGQCQLEYILSDAPTSAVNIKSSTVRIDNILVGRYLNDNVHPYQYGAVSMISGVTQVACGLPHVVTAFIVRLGVGTVSEKVGSLPAVACPPLVP